jgi:hypothetical protein
MLPFMASPPFARFFPGLLYIGPLYRFDITTVYIESIYTSRRIVEKELFGGGDGGFPLRA